MRALLDTNILLDVLLNRVPWQAEADAILHASREGRLITVVSALTIANAFYVGRRSVGTEAARAGVRDCLAAFEVVALDRDLLEAADAWPGSDFEDNIQVESAIRAGVDCIVTRDPRGFAGSPISVLTPADLLALLQEDDEA